MYYSRNDIMKIYNLFRREENIKFWGVPKFRLYRTGGELAEKIHSFISSPTGRWGMAMAREEWPNDYFANLIILIL